MKTKTEKELETEKIHKALSDINLTLTLAAEPSEESLLEIIQFLKSSHLQLPNQKHNTIELIEEHYTHWACAELATLILSTYNNHEQLFYIQTLSEHPFFTMRPSVSKHILIEFDGYYYDIRGKHTLEELKLFCEKEYYWRGITIHERKHLTPAELEQNKLYLNSVVQYCAKNTTTGYTTTP